MPVTPPLAVAHANGSLAFILVGDDRLRAHETIRSLTAVAVEPGECVAPEVDEQVRAWVKRDPSLFVELIPVANPFGVQGAGTWETHRTWWGTWANKLATIGCFSATEELFKVGVHPDDGEVFIHRVIWQPNWNSSPASLETVLKHGANPDVIESIEKPGGFRADPNNSVIRACLKRVGRAAASVWDESETTISGSVASRENPTRFEAMRAAIECTQRLLHAGARRMDPVKHDVLWDDGEVMASQQDCETAIGMLVDGLRRLAGRPEDRDLLQQLCRSLHAVGADVDRPSGRPAGSEALTPCARAIQNRDIETFKLLLSLGAKVTAADIAYEVRAWDDEAVEAAFRAEVMEAIMHQAATGEKVPEATPTARRVARAAV